MLLNTFVALLIAILFVNTFRHDRLIRLPALWAVAVVVSLTAVFDPLIIASGIVAYNRTLISGLYWFGAPVEDFAYAVVAGLLLPLLWRHYED